MSRMYVLVFTLVLVFSGHVHADKLIFGVQPFFHYPMLMGTVKDHNDHLERSLGLAVEVPMASTYRSFINNAIRGDYDLVYCDPHIALFLINTHGLRPIMQLRSNLSVSIVASSEADIHQLSDLRGKRLAFPDQLALESMIVKSRLESIGLSSSFDYITTSEKSEHTILSVFKGHADAAVTVSTDINRVGGMVKNKIRLVDEVDLSDIPQGVYLLKPSVSKEISNGIRDALISFSDTVEGEGFFRSYTDQGYFETVKIEELIRVKEYSDKLGIFFN